MSVVVDAKNLDCPMPVIKTKKALEGMDSGVVEVYLNAETPKINVLKFAQSQGLEAEIIKDEAEEIIIRIVKGEGASSDEAPQETVEVKSRNEVVFVTQERMGAGNDELGEVLMKSFMFTLTETEPLPNKMIFVNGGVTLTTKNKAVIEHLKKLEDNGVTIISCGTCLDYYHLKEEVQVGGVSNMYEIVESLKAATNIITI